MRLNKLILAFTVLFSIHGKIIAQDTTNASQKKDTTDLMTQLEKSGEKTKALYQNTFTYTRIINGQSVENLPANVLDFRISHRFGPLNKGIYNFLGLDYAAFNVRIGFDYGITNNFMIGVGHNAYLKTYDAFFKLKILKQSKGTTNMPFTVSFVPTIAINTVKADDFGYDISDSTATQKDKASYVLQLLIGRKFSEAFSLQVMPTYIHADNISFNHYKNNSYNRDIFAVGLAARQKISKRMSIDAEYYYQLSGAASNATNSASVGLEIGTGGHVFQLLFTNALGLTEKSFISETYKHDISDSGFDRHGLRFGFNISRVFQLGKKHRENKSKDWDKK